MKHAKSKQVGAIFLLMAAAALPARAATSVSGTLESDTWTVEKSPIVIAANANLPAGKTLVIGPGVDVTFGPAVTLLIRGTLEVNGTAEAWVRFIRADPAKEYAGVGILGSAARATIHYLEMTGAKLADTGIAEFPSAFRINDHAKVRIENSWFHHFPGKVLDAGIASEMVIYDTLVEHSMEGIHSKDSYCWLERVTVYGLVGYSDCVDFDGTSTPLSGLKDCLLDENAEDDGFDTDRTNCTLENVVIKHIHKGKAMSLQGESSPVFKNCVVADSMWGIVSKDGCTPVFEHTTVINCDVGINCYQKNPPAGGGHGQGDSMVFWGNKEMIRLDVDCPYTPCPKLSSFDLTHSIVQGGYPGEGNIDQDPLLVDAAHDDFHLKAGSPAIGTGKDGTDMGAFPYVPPAPEFIRGDANGDGEVDVSDAIGILFYLFFAVNPAPTCLEAFDFDDGGKVDLLDATSLLGYLFLAGAAPQPPFPAPGVDTTPDDAQPCT